MRDLKRTFSLFEQITLLTRIETQGVNRGRRCYWVPFFSLLFLSGFFCKVHYVPFVISVLLFWFFSFLLFSFLFCSLDSLYLSLPGLLLSHYLLSLTHCRPCTSFVPFSFESSSSLSNKVQSVNQNSIPFF